MGLPMWVKSKGYGTHPQQACRRHDLPCPDALCPAGFVKPRSQLAADHGARESFRGTPDYASDHALEQHVQAPLDDLISLGYSLLEMDLGRYT